MSRQLSRSRQRAFTRQSGRCYYCDLPMWAAPPAGLKLLKCTAEHLLARCEGGRDDLGNIVAACLYCNRTRHRMENPPSPSEYRLEVQRRMAQGHWHHSSITTAALRCLENRASFCFSLPTNQQPRC